MHLAEEIRHTHIIYDLCSPERNTVIKSYLLHRTFRIKYGEVYLSCMVYISGMYPFPISINASWYSRPWICGFPKLVAFLNLGSPHLFSFPLSCCPFKHLMEEPLQLYSHKVTKSFQRSYFNYFQYLLCTVCLTNYIISNSLYLLDIRSDHHR